MLNVAALKEILHRLASAAGVSELHNLIEELETAVEEALDVGDQVAEPTEPAQPVAAPAVTHPPPG